MLCQQCKREFKEEELIKEITYNEETGEEEPFHWCQQCKDEFELKRKKSEKEHLEYEHEREIKDIIEAAVFDSYKGIDESQKIYCSKCGELLKYNSINYYEGFHVDGCE